MSLPQDFWKQLPERTDAELYDMLTHPDDYQPEAIEAAKDELRKRNLAPERAAQLEGIAQSQKAVEDTNANQPLGWPVRILILMGCSGIFGVPWAVFYESNGYKRKASQCWVLTGISVAFWWGLALLMYLGR
jgi:hypothetical protein